MTKAAETLSARDRIMETAERLFLQEGFRATGIDRIIAESGVAKMSLYRHFPSKSDLIAAFLDVRHERWMTWFREETEARVAKRAELDVLADVLASWFSTDTYRGCAFINLVAESGTETGDAQLVEKAVAHKADLGAYLAELARRLGYPRPKAVAEEALLCVEGMIVRYQMTGNRAAVDAGRRLLARLR
ncbi:TetR family transcriptional regulator [Ralstonia sp. A12]|uniref:TetR/AcrR family transcriptional regulator n=1 Tax=Ralstonia sp. A12 TaxID=1217052 RepID=UPI0005730917|nr:TetR/AcrR family transcriptional regulator [Ralstonia sp. A12]KHK49751.1 TetR family transcriptional regulator [Ralstonia sp. A12]